MKTIEFIGLPDSGKTTVLKKIKSQALNYKKNSHTYENFLFNFYKKKNKKNIFIFLIKKFNSLIFFHQNKKYTIKNKLKDISVKILVKLILLSIKNSKEHLVYKIYMKILSYSAHSKLRKKRMEIYFLLKIFSFKLSVKKQKSLYFILDDEGFYQNVIIKYQNFERNKKNIFKEIKKYIDLCPRPNFLIIVNSKNKEIINRIKLRKNGHQYFEDDLSNDLQNWYQVRSFLISLINKKNTKMLKFNNNKSISEFKIKKLINRLVC